MPARAMKRGGAIDIPADVIIAIARNPDGFEEKCAEIAERIRKAHEAENDARAAEAKAMEEQKKALDLVNTHQESMKAAEVTNAAETARLAAEDESLVERAALLDDIALGLDAREERVGQREAEATATSDRLTAQAQALDDKVAGLDEIEDALKEREDAVTAREAKFKNRLTRFNEGLD